MNLIIPCVGCRRALIGAAWIVFASGCGSSRGPATIEVTGTVTQAGKPVEGANVIFHPLEQAESVLVSQSITDREGRFAMETHIGGGKFQPGIVAGKYAVAITKLDTAAISSTLAPPQNLLPKAYGNPDSSGLTADVVAGRKNHFDFKIDAK